MSWQRGVGVIQPALGPSGLIPAGLQFRGTPVQRRRQFVTFREQCISGLLQPSDRRRQACNRFEE
jgi:hypothetical protein